jgi:hypothetical protein
MISASLLEPVQPDQRDGAQLECAVPDVVKFRFRG